MAPSRRSPDVRPTTSSISAHSTPTPASPRARQQYYAQTHGIKQFYRAGAAWLGEDVSFRRLPVLADEPRHAHHSADKAPVDRNERPARHTARHTGLSFNVPFSSNLAGPDPDDIMWASPGAKARWTHPEDTAEATPTHKLPVHAQNVDNLRNLCRDVSEQTEGRVQATVTSAESKPLPGLQRGPLRALVTNVCLSGELEIVNSMRCRVLNSTPISLVGTDPLAAAVTTDSLTSWHSAPRMLTSTRNSSSTRPPRTSRAPC
jgi:hypothetical protein